MALSLLIILVYNVPNCSALADQYKRLPELLDAYMR